MPVRIAPPRRRAVSMTSLTDVIFLLLLFFMLSSTFTKFSEVPLSSGGRSASTAPMSPTPLFLRLGADDLRLNGDVLTMAALSERLEIISDEDAILLLVDPAGKDVTSQRLVDLLVVLRGFDGLQIRVLE